MGGNHSSLEFDETAYIKIEHLLYPTLTKSHEALLVYLFPNEFLLHPFANGRIAIPLLAAYN